MAYMKKTKLQDGTTSYSIQSKIKDPLTKKYKYLCETWRKPPEMTEYEAKRIVDKKRYELDEKLKQQVLGILAGNANITLEKFSKDWLDRQLLNHNELYKLRHEPNVKTINAFFKQITLSELTPTLIQNFRDNLLAHQIIHESAVMKQGKDLRLILKSKGIVAKRLKDYIGVGFSTYESAHRGNPILYENAVNLCKGLGVNFDEYFEKKITQRPYSKVSVSHIMQTLNMILTDAKRKRIIQDNFASSEYLEPLKKERKEISILDDDEARQLKKALDLEKNTRWKTAIYIALFTGIRRSELCGLEWKDIDFEEKTLTISRACYDVRGMGLVTKETKTNSSTRTITIPDTLLRVLEDYKLWWDYRKSILGDDWAKSDRLFINDEGSIIHPEMFRKWLGKILKKAGLKDVVLHTLRHTNITMQLTAGVDLRTVAARAGHSRTSTTTDVYSHFLKSSDKHASKVIDNLFDENIN